MENLNVYTDLLGVQSGTGSAVFSSGGIGPGFFTPAQRDFMATRTRFGGPDDPNTGTFHLSRIIWDKETGNAVVGMTMPMGDGWYSGTGDEVADPAGDCGCGGGGGGCGCS